MKRSGKNFTFSQEELEAMLATGNLEGMLTKMTGLKKKKASPKDIDALVDEILGDINNMGRPKPKKKRAVPEPSEPYRGCGFGGGRC